MKTNSERKAEIKHLMDSVGDMKARCVAENREPSTEEQAMTNDALRRVRELRSLIQMEEEIQLTEGIVSKPTTDPIKPDPENRERAVAYGGIEKKDRFLTLGEQMQAVMRAGAPGGQVDSRLLQTRAATGLGESVPSDGGLI